MIWGSSLLGSCSFLLCPHLADGPRGPGGQSTPSLFVGCSLCSCSPLVSIRRGFEFSLGEVSDSPRVPGGRSAGAWRTVHVLPTDGSLFGVVSGGSICFFGRSAAQGRTVRGVCADSSRQQAGRSTWPMRTVRPSWPDGPPKPECFVPWFDSSLPSFVLPRVLQGIIPNT
jgi:hypothetical protein